MMKITTVEISTTTLGIFAAHLVNLFGKLPEEPSPAAAGGEPRAAAAHDPVRLKIGAGGEVMPPGATDHVAVLDEATGLMWSVKTLDRMDWEAASKACAGYQLLGNSDWRLPTMKELQGLVDYEKRDPAIDTAFFPGTKSDWYWSSSPVVGWPEYAWSVGFSYGYVCNYNRYDSGFVRPVRAARARQ